MFLLESINGKAARRAKRQSATFERISIEPASIVVIALANDFAATNDD
jgi:hypothetical protein